MIGVALVAVKAIENEVVVVDVQFLAWVLGVACPILVAVVTKKVASSQLKAITLALLATVAGLVAVAIEADGAIEWKGWASGIMQSLVVAWASYHAFLKPVGVTPYVQAKTARFGIGPRCASEGPRAA